MNKITEIKLIDLFNITIKTKIQKIDFIIRNKSIFNFYYNKRRNIVAELKGEKQIKVEIFYNDLITHLQLTNKIENET